MLGCRRETTKIKPRAFPTLGTEMWCTIFEGLVTRSHLTLCDLMDWSPPGSSVHGISQARIMEWVAISSFRESSWPRDQPGSPAFQADSSPSEPPVETELDDSYMYCRKNWKKYTSSTTHDEIMKNIFLFSKGFKMYLLQSMYQLEGALGCISYSAWSLAVFWI